MSRSAPADPAAQPSRPPDPRPAAYLILWGLAAVLLGVLALTAVALGRLSQEVDRKALDAARSSEAQRLRQRQEQELERGSRAGMPIDAAMDEVVKQYGRQPK